MTQTHTRPPALATRVGAARISSVALVFALAPAPASLAAPEPASLAAPEPASLVAPEPAALEDREQATTFIDLGAKKREAGELEVAIRMWEQAYQLLPAVDRWELRPSLAQVHFELYQRSGSVDNLRRAHALNLEHFDQVDPSDAAALEIAQEAVVETEAELDRLAAEQAEEQRRAQEQAEEQRRAQEQAEAQQTALDRQLREQQQRIAEQERALELARAKRDRRLLIVGGSLTGLGVAGVAAMAASLGVAGQRHTELDVYFDEQNNYTQDYTAAQAERYYAIERELSSAKTAAIVAGIGGGALLITGMALLVPPLQRRGAARADARVDARGLTLKF